MTTRPVQINIAPRFAFGFLALLLPFTSLGATTLPNAGSILQQVQPSEIRQPSSNGTGLTIEPQSAGKLSSITSFEIRVLEISGNSLFTSRALHMLVADAEGTTVTLSKLGDLAARITTFYHNHGYPLARAYIPAQTINDGIVSIKVIEARYGKIQLANSSVVSKKLLESTFSSIQSGNFIEQSQLNRSLLLLSDIPGILIDATLKPGQSVGTSDLMIQTKPNAMVNGYMSMDNSGNRYTGWERATGLLSINNPLRHGDSLDFSYLTSGADMRYGRIGYDFLLNWTGSHVGGAYSALHYVLGSDFESLDGHGTAQAGNLWFKQTVIRSRSFNVYAQIEYDHTQLRDHIDISGTLTDRHLESWTGSLSGDWRDAYVHGPAVNTMNLAWTTGRVHFDNAMAQSSDILTANTQDGYERFNANVTRLQDLGQNNALFVNYMIQGSNGNLDQSQKMIVGGSNSVRAYDTGVISADSGYLFTVEYRHDINQVWHGQWEWIAFLDTAHVKIDRDPWVETINGATLTGVGLGFNWTNPDRWNAKSFVAMPVNSTPEILGDTPSFTGWVQIGREF